MEYKILSQKSLHCFTINRNEFVSHTLISLKKYPFRIDFFFRNTFNRIYSRFLQYLSAFVELST